MPHYMLFLVHYIKSTYWEYEILQYSLKILLKTKFIEKIILFHDEVSNNHESP